MRGIGLIASTILLASCGGQAPGNEASPNGDPLVQTADESNGAAASEEPVTEADNAIADAEPEGPASPCLTQASERLEVQPIRAIGTEPFWSARVEGRCVTYSTPEDQRGVRVWTRYSAEPSGRGTWVGQLGGKPFEMRARPEPACSDGMSDKIYPIAVELTVNGEQRRGCAEPL